eukprot:Plantae.Rhodophyta-Purpureofilum_apyrenoidigerum.ctg34900.p2 GENE.Plantae.Rhodophyta-Purpureofilum_apyrenoidigerum.ctg34900~~Plantae.Rhodophyta-Purpureofilum_apyrenoidigerum.ctg34900.p2  ORF type:complete len:220 (+),score=28.79 Plantae.Rhodophyta-Purpureofilum_apyrenoidigerum.ctg34900:88-660(+)
MAELRAAFVGAGCVRGRAAGPEAVSMKMSSAAAENGRFRVFVYGTLKRSYPNASLLTEAEFRGRYRTTEKFPLVVGGEFFSPYLLDRAGEGHRVHGEVYLVDRKTLDFLDEFECTGVNYTRSTISVRSGDGWPVQVYTYLKCNYTPELLASEHMPDYKDRRYVPRHMRGRKLQELQLAEKKVAVPVRARA